MGWRAAWIVLVYLAGGSLWVYAVVDREGSVGTLWQLVLLYAGHVLVGLAARSWWVLPLPLLLPVIAVPAGGIPGGGDLDRAWEIPLLMAPALVVALAVGVALPQATARLLRHGIGSRRA